MFRFPCSSIKATTYHMNYLLQTKIKQIKICCVTNVVDSIININQKYINVIQVPGKCIYPERGSVDQDFIFYTHTMVIKNMDIVLTASYNLPH